MRNTLLLVTSLMLVLISPSFAKEKKDFIVIDGTKYIVSPKAKDSTVLDGDSSAIIQLKANSTEVGSAVIFYLSAGEDFTTFKKGLSVDILNESLEIDESEDDFDFVNEAVIDLNHTFLDGETAVTYSNDESSTVTGTLKLISFNKRKGTALFTFTCTISNALVTTNDAELNESTSRLTEDVEVKGSFTTVLFE